MEFNLETGSSVRYILVQLPEAINEDDKNQKAGYAFCKKLGVKETIAEISKERIRRAGGKIKRYNIEKEGIENLDIGFRVLRIDSSNMSEVYYTPDAVSQADLLGQIDNVRADRTAEDLLFQVLLDWGVDLALPIHPEAIDEKTVYFVDGAETNMALAACFDTGITEDFVKKLAKRQPLRAVFRDAGFANDSVKINVEQIFKLMSPTTEVKTI
jgi:adenine-specific DNA-methyltransferase